jgi:hypothetical protein
MHRPVLAARLLMTLLLFGADALAQTAPPENASLAITGDVASPLQLKLEDLSKMPRETASVREQDGTAVQYEGVPCARC